MWINVENFPPERRKKSFPHSPNGGKRMNSPSSGLRFPPSKRKKLGKSIPRFRPESPMWIVENFSLFFWGKRWGKRGEKSPAFLQKRGKMRGGKTGRGDSTGDNVENTGKVFGECGGKRGNLPPQQKFIYTNKCY